MVNEFNLIYRGVELTIRSLFPIKDKLYVKILFGRRDKPLGSDSLAEKLLYQMIDVLPSTSSLPEQVYDLFGLTDRGIKDLESPQMMEWLMYMELHHPRVPPMSVLDIKYGHENLDKFLRDAQPFKSVMTLRNEFEKVTDKQKE
ncbi:unnamed protein product [Peronospora belbahrii]|uniref:Uncharacterized protein n=1 Tax=Peronospora belbahrii TaxID=622444 RepID=A0AAU9LFM1_9STRA|nr:unnamed protein product [Peronospora belbahrii]